MKKTLKIGLVALSICAFGALMVSQGNAAGNEANAEVILSVDAGTITIGTSGATLHLGTGVGGEVREGQFSANSFWVKDLKGSKSGFRTTIQVTDLTGSIDGVEHKILKENVKFKSSAITKINGADNANVKTEPTEYTSIAQPITFINRKQNTPAGILGEYGEAPHVQVTIPEYTAPTQYKGIITYTLYEPGNQ